MKLYKRPDGRSENWYVRLIIPTLLQKVFGSDRFIASTKSSDKTLARARAAEIVAVWERKLYHQAMTLRDSGRFEEREPRPAVISQDLIELLCTSRIGSHMQTDDAERVVGLTEKQSLEIDDSVLARLADATAVAIRGKGATKEYARLHEDAEDWAHQLVYDFDDSDPLLPEYVVAFAKAQKQALDLIARRQKGDDARTPDDTLGKSLVELADAWREDNKTLLDERTLKSYPRRFEAFDHYRVGIIAMVRGSGKATPQSRSCSSAAIVSVYSGTAERMLARTLLRNLTPKCEAAPKGRLIAS